MSEELKPCPWPGCAAGVEAGYNGDEDGGYGFVHCNSKAHICIVEADTDEEAIDAWNRRAPDAKAKALVEAATEILLHACLADADPRDVDEEDKVRERALRAALKAMGPKP